MKKLKVACFVCQFRNKHNRSARSQQVVVVVVVRMGGHGFWFLIDFCTVLVFFPLFSPFGLLEGEPVVTLHWGIILHAVH